MSDGGNWVEHLAIMDKVLLEQAPEVWAALRSVLDDSCGSYNKHYSISGVNKVEYLPENGKRVRIKFTRVESNALRPCEAIVRFDEDTPCIEVSGDLPKKKLLIKADTDKAFIVLGDKVLTADDAAKFILEPAFFKSGERRSVKI